MINQTISHYKIIEKLGEGGMGEVYLAEDIVLDRKVALKFLPPQYISDPELNKRFRREAKAAAALNHPNIVTVHEIGEHKGRAYIVMEYVEGESLRNIVGANGRSPLPFDQIINIIIQLCDGLNAAHQAGIIHRDIKPENIIVDKSGRVRILDFGLARMTGVTKLTKEATTLGTISYMSPEQFRGEPVDHSADIWAVGVVLYEMLTGVLPFRGEYELAVIYSVGNEEPEPITHLRSDTPTGLLQIVSRCLEKQSTSRYQSTSELLEDLTSVTGDQGWHPSTKLTRLAPTKPFVLSRNRKYWGVVAGMLLVILLGTLFPPINRLVKRWLGFAEIPSQKHLLVLPLTNVGGDDSNQAFCDGVMETLTSKLTQLEQFQGALWVVPASEVRKGGIESANEAHRAFGVNLVVSGSLQKIDERFRLTLNLVDAKNLRQLSSTVIDNRMSNLAILQDEIVLKMAQMLNVELHPHARTALTVGETKVADAYGFYLHGLGFLQQYDKIENIDTAISLFTKAIELDSLYALAMAGLGEAYWRKYETVKDAQWAEKAILHGERAARINNRLVPVNVTLGLIYTGTGRYEQAIEAFNHALSIDPSISDAYRGLASAYEAQGNLEDAEAIYKRAIELKPDYWAGYNSLGVFYYRYGRYEDAIKEFRKVIELVPQSDRGYRNLGGMYFFLNRWSEAIEMFERSVEIKPNYTAYSNLATLYHYEEQYVDAARMYEKALEYNDRDHTVWGNLASTYSSIPGEREKAQKTYQRALQLAEEKRMVNPRDPEILFDLASYYKATNDSAQAQSLLQQAIALQPDQSDLLFRIANFYEDLGERELALQWLAKALDSGYSLSVIERYQGLKELRADPRYQQLLKRVENNTHQDDK